MFGINIEISVVVLYFIVKLIKLLKSDSIIVLIKNCSIIKLGVVFNVFKVLIICVCFVIEISMIFIILILLIMRLIFMIFVVIVVVFLVNLLILVWVFLVV